jgi:hypothetical protein
LPRIHYEPTGLAGTCREMTTRSVIHIVNDDAAVRDALTFLLESANLTVRTYESASG